MIFNLNELKFFNINYQRICTEIRNKLILLLCLTCLFLISPIVTYSAHLEIVETEKTAFTLAKTLYSEGLLDLSAQQFNLFVNNYPDSPLAPDACFYGAEALKRSGRYKDAIVMYGKILEMYPDFAKVNETVKKISECSQNLIINEGIEDNEALFTIFEKIFDRYSERFHTTGLAYYYAHLLYMRQRYNESLGIFERLSSNIPAGIPADELFFTLGDCYYRTGDNRSALDKWLHVVKKYSKLSFAEKSLFNVGVLHFMEGNYKESKVSFERLINGYPGGNLYQKALYGIVWSFWKEGMYEESAQYLRMYEEKNNTDEKNLVIAWESFYKKDFVYAYEGMKKILEKNKDTGLRDAALLLMGKSAEGRGDFKEALKIYQRFMKEFPENPRIYDAYNRTVKIYLTLGDLDSATKILESYTEKYASSLPIQQDLRQDSSVKDFNQEPDSGLDSMQIADNYQETGEAEKAIELYRDLLDKASEPLFKLSIRNRLRKVYFEKGMYKEYTESSIQFIHYEPGVLMPDIEGVKPGKKKDTEQAMSKDEDQPFKIESGAISLYMTADTLLQSGYPEQAYEIFRKIIDNYPDEKGLDEERLKIGLLFLKEKEYDRAIKSFIQTIHGTGDSKLKVEAHFWLGESFQNSGRLEDAVLEYLKIPYLYPENDLWAGTARFRAGEIFERQGKLDDAVVMYQKLVLKYKNDKRGKFAAKKMEEIRKSRMKNKK